MCELKYSTSRRNSNTSCNYRKHGSCPHWCGLACPLRSLLLQCNLSDDWRTYLMDWLRALISPPLPVPSCPGTHRALSSLGTNLGAISSESMNKTMYIYATKPNLITSPALHPPKCPSVAPPMPLAWRGEWQELVEIESALVTSPGRNRPWCEVH